MSKLETLISEYGRDDTEELFSELESLRQKVIDYALVVEKFQKHLNSYTTTEALVKLVRLKETLDLAYESVGNAIQAEIARSYVGGVDVQTPITETIDAIVKAQRILNGDDG